MLLSKSLSIPEIKSESSGRIVTGICAVFGNVDSVGDRIQSGAFTKTLRENSLDNFKHLWNHNFGGFPTAKILELKEIGRGELPREILDRVPEATGGLLVKREYVSDNGGDGDKAFAGIKAGTITQMSFGYDAVKHEMKSENGVEVRELKELKLYDTSDVLWGANSATVAAGLKTFSETHDFKALLQEDADIYFDLLPEMFKVGRTISAANMEKLRGIWNVLKELGIDAETITETTEEGNAQEAEAGKSTSLIRAQAILAKLRTQNI
jgi:HK97 family phage prohead protease